ncbi:aa3-type cytochrome c oxidase subunit IV [Brevundimonas sp. AJA228-03]|uniref:aa3-type cytochrome c oxidase subunit IV n=1 Tax=Brevundimonas sp. AJA228-03 TaxID=2752515 RepID=UPI001AE0008B|nr:aa3-type cytochrome c oxidase subunit IV [Brevundimonas sp. AJA228-03]QTN20427.1 aa3-type cytochrome c oxidase subunit IV [Brevundimonas sp. AJA228-03]
MADHHHDTLHAAADHDAEAYVHGTMTIEEQAATWALFQDLAKWGSLVVAVVLLFLTLAFQPGGSIVGGLISAAVVGAAGFFFLKGGKKADH